MQLLVGMQHWSYHRTYWYNWGNYLHDYLDRVIAFADKHDFHPMGVDIVADHLALREPAYVTDVKRKLDDNDLIPVFGVGALQVHADKEVCDRSLEQAVENLRFANMLGAKVVMYTAVYHGRMNREAHIDVYSNLAGRLADAAQPYGIKVCHENYDYFTSKDFLEVMRRCDRSNLGCLNDFGNWLITHEDPLEATRCILDHTVHVHVKDYRVENGIYTSVPFGEGVIDIPALVREVKQVPGEGRLQLAIEVDLDEGHEDTALDACGVYIRELMNQL